ncbi:SH3-like domain-containing protein [Pseudonocardia halophobica]|uniref:SH3-like domain-containing protein n=1 Tax=Pseudonocardia halophobica TaxID=29401 RepID=UPI003D8C39FF
MARVSDLGGAPGHGPVPAPDPAEPVFGERWEGRAFALTAFTIGRLSGRNLEAFRDTLDRLTPAEYHDPGYFGRWLHAAEAMLVASAVLAPGAVDARARRLAGETVEDPPDPPEPAKPDYAPTAPGSLREVEATPEYAVDDRVRAREGARLPGYARGRVGTVARVQPAHVLPDTHAVFAGENAQHVYTVRFSAHELWGDGDDVVVTLELFETYLERA